MSALSESASELDRRVAAFLDFVKEELAPYPGRGAVVARMVVSSVLVMILVMTFRIPGAALAGYYTLLLSRESPRATLAGAVELIVAFAAGGVYVLLSALLFFGSPVLHFLWVVVSFFVVFLAVRVMRSYSAGAAFAFVIATCIPVWERVQPPEQSVESTLWIAGSVAVGAAVTVAVEYVAAPFRKYGAFEEGILDRWHAVSGTLRQIASGQGTGDAEKRLTQFASIGVSRLRRIVLRSGNGVGFIERAGTIISITERIVDLGAALVQVSADSARGEESRLLRAASELDNIAARFISSSSSPSNAETFYLHPLPSELPFLAEIERNIALLQEALEARPDTDGAAVMTQAETRLPLLLSDAWTNPEHLRFALKGCLAATICYVTYTAIGWPGLNTSVATCLVTALSSIGSSRQKQILRITGAVTGGVIFGMGAQVFVLPHMDSITAFTLLFAAVTAVAAWCSTASARLSYFGLQIALAFFLINLQEFAFQTSLTIARDRVFGILLGLIVMWMIFDLLGGVPAAEQMTAHFRKAVLLLAELQELSLSTDANTMTRRVQEIRENLVEVFAAINTEADAVLLETGPRRNADLLLRQRILTVLPSLRSLLLLQVTMLQYRRQRLMHELPLPIAQALRSFDQSVADFLRRLAADYPARPVTQALHPFEELRATVVAYYQQTSGGVLTSSAIAVLSLAQTISSTLESVESEASRAEAFTA